ncbi:hypothetical protein Ndes2526B_g03821 [Nannochloris sp. 'desiccata']|nr:hypothetical protein KSW81_005321 [Chlorella desiccata (nom. nud.)]KAH7621474.1 hypothetical protein NADE_006737 [Chlorella desiccata (nom. nud.)]
MQRPSRGPFALLGTAAALGVGFRAIKKARPFQACNALNPLSSTFLPASLASFELAAESAYSSSTCKPGVWSITIKDGILLVVFLAGVVLCGQAALAANIGYPRIAGFTFAVGSASYTAASKLFGIEKETAILGLKIDQETAILGLKIDHLETSQAEVKADLKEMKFYFIGMGVILSTLILLKR